MVLARVAAFTDRQQVSRMPEGDTIHRAAQRLAPVLVGQVVRSLELPRRALRFDSASGQRVERVEARGKNLLVFFSGDLVLHTHMKMNGSWRALGPGQPRPAPSGNLVASIELENGWGAYCWRAPIARVLRARDVEIDPRLASLGPDVLGASFDIERALGRLAALSEVPIGEAILDQRVVAGIGNVWKSELLFQLSIDPFATVAALTSEQRRSLLEAAAKHMARAVRKGTASIAGSAGSAPRPQKVYRRRGQPCLRCPHGVIAMQRQGEMQRSTYYCPVCQGTGGQSPSGAPGAELT